MLYLLAGNGSPNFGDELIVRHWLKYYRERGYTGPITVDGKGAKRTAELLRDFGDVAFVTSIPRHADDIDGSYGDFQTVGQDWARNNRSKFSAVKGFHFLGGGYASANWVNATRMLSTVAELGKLLDVPAVATGLGISPFKTFTENDRAAWASIVRGFQIFECRDEPSYDDLAVALGKPIGSLTLGLDDCFLYPVQTAPHAGRWLHLSGYSEHAVMGKQRQQAEALFSEFDRVLFWTCSTADQKLFEELAAANPRIESVGNDSLLNTGLPVQPGDFMLSGRFHPHLLASRAGISGYYTASSDFYKTKHGLVTDLGSPFLKVGQNLSVFTGDSARMLSCDPGRVEEKRRVAGRVAKFMGV